MELISIKDPICGSLPPILQYVYQSSSEKFFVNDGTLDTEPEEEWELHMLLNSTFVGVPYLQISTLIMLRESLKTGLFS